ncbi:MAG: hypothetical protein EBS84_13525 [Proteobacteria bacterium]|nr:hypothetical protein [Pseudomonadota bacterium]
MKRTKPLPIPQKEFGFAKDTFNLIQDWTADGVRLARELAEVQQARQLAEAAHVRLFPTED